MPHIANTIAVRDISFFDVLPSSSAINFINVKPDLLNPVWEKFLVRFSKVAMFTASLYGAL